jgi:hypothetical protein
MADREPDLAPVLPDEVGFRVQFSLSVRRDALSVDAVRIVRDALVAEVTARRGELVPQ